MDEYKEPDEQNRDFYVSELSKIDEDGNIHEVESFHEQIENQKDPNRIPLNFNNIDEQIINLYNSTDNYNKMIPILISINELIKDNDTRLSLFKDERGDSTFIHTLMDIFHSHANRFELAPYILNIFSNTLKAKSSDINIFYTHLINSLFLCQLLGFEDDHVLSEDLHPILSENQEFVIALCIFLKNLSKSTESSTKEYWSNLCPFFDCLLETINDPETNNLVFKILFNALKNVYKIRDKFEFQKYHIYALNVIRNHSSLDIESACAFLAEMITYGFEWIIPLPSDWFEIIGDIIVNNDDEEIVTLSVLKLIAKWTSHSDKCCSILYDCDYPRILIDSSMESTYECRKYALKALMSILTNAQEKESCLIDFVKQEENLNFLIPFLETEDQQIIRVVLDKLAYLVVHARLEPDIYKVFDESPDVMDIIYQYHEADENDENSNYYETASYIITEMEGNRDSQTH